MRAGVMPMYRPWPTAAGGVRYATLKPDLSDTATAILLAVMTLQRPTVRTVADEVGIQISSAVYQLRRLKDLGLVDWVPGQSATLHATCQIVRMCDGTP